MDTRLFKTIKLKDWHICLIIYFLALGLTLGYAITRMVIVSDQATEYALYLQAIESGSWHFIQDNIVNSCLMITFVPATIQRITHIDATLLFKIYPCFFYSLMPMFIYLTSRQYLNIRYSLVSAFIILTNFYFLYDSSMGRVSIAWAFFAGLIWATLSRRFLLALIMVILVVFSHYGTAYVAIVILGTTWLASLVRRKWNIEFRNMGIILAVLVLTTLVWHNAIAKESGRYAEAFFISSITLQPTTPHDVTQKFEVTPTPTPISEVTPTPTPTSEATPTPTPTSEATPTHTPASEVTPLPSQTPNTQANAISTTEKNEIAQRIGTIFDLQYKESVVQVAFGKTLPYMNIPQKIEFVLSWLIIFLLSIGLLMTLIRRRLSDTHAIMAVTAYGLIVLTVAIPWLSYYYGITRVYFTALAIIAPCFAMGTQEVSKLLRVNGYILPVILLVFYALSVSGILHSWFGIIK